MQRGVPRKKKETPSPPTTSVRPPGPVETVREVSEWVDGVWGPSKMVDAVGVVVPNREDGEDKVLDPVRDVDWWV